MIAAYPNRSYSQHYCFEVTPLRIGDERGGNGSYDDVGERLTDAVFNIQLPMPLICEAWMVCQVAAKIAYRFVACFVDAFAFKIDRRF